MIISLLLNGLFAFGIYNQLIHRTIPSYYATSGIKPPIQLNPLSHPNDSSEALLAPDPDTDGETAGIGKGEYRD